MTRGQESLAIGLEEFDAEVLQARRTRIDDLELIVLTASEEELTEHLSILRQIDDETRGQCVWLSSG